MRIILAGVLGLWAAAAAAGDVALILGNEDYRRLADVRGADDVIAPGGSLSRQGFRVISARNADAAIMARSLASFAEAADGADRVLVILNGHFVSSATDAWLLPVDAPETPALGELPGYGLPLSVVRAILAGHPGKAVLVLGRSAAEGWRNVGGWPGSIRTPSPTGRRRAA